MINSNPIPPFFLSQEVITYDAMAAIDMAFGGDLDLGDLGQIIGLL